MIGISEIKPTNERKQKTTHTESQKYSIQQNKPDT